MILNRSGRAVLATTAVVSMTAGAACGDTSDATGDAAAPVIATTSIWADIVSEVGCGADVPALIPPGADPHAFEPSLRDRELALAATTVIANGLDLEVSVLPLLDGAAVIEMTNHIDVIETHDDHDDHDDDHAHGHGSDPHVWQDPRRVAGAFDTIATALAAHDIATCADAYRDELLALDAEIEALLAGIPDSARILVTSHASLAYFADRYEFEVVGTVIPSTNTLAATNAADLADLAATIERRDIPAIFTERLESTADADALARRLGVDVVPLVTDALTDEPGSDTYVGMMRHNANAIAEALTP